ncbi:hypothetical protein HU200_045484 [Digitaria exilis]|uniref:F-box domain-containing protein n=1 Tax=Digitaria exilis TaxID=1010633 RepID=A0A835B0J4_9POAL|nr:hypothetical protein HU200_045484 [Digitaria exilis]
MFRTKEIARKPDDDRKVGVEGTMDDHPLAWHGHPLSLRHTTTSAVKSGPGISSRPVMATETVHRVLKTKRANPTPCHVMLPDNLIAEVLVCLPARSLVRFRCACCSWNTEISSCAFQERHHALAASQFLLLQLAPPHIAYNASRAHPDCPGVIGSKPCFGLILVERPCHGALFKGCVLALASTRLSGSFKVVKVGVQLGTLEATVLTVGNAQGWRAPVATFLVDFSVDETGVRR